MKILHIADLHLTKEIKNDEAFKNRLKLLVEVLKKYKYDVCLFTGDLKNWDNDLWDSVLVFVNRLIKDLEISNIIVVPGNHDIVSEEIYSFDRVTYRCSIYDDKNGTYINKAKSQYKKFEDGFINKIDANIPIIHPGINHKVVNINKIEFFVINSVFAFCAKEASKGIKQFPFCYNCKQLKKLYLNNSELSKLSRVVVTHVPFDDKDSCFNRYNYNDKYITKKFFEDNFFCCFAGHEHTKNNDFYKVIGSPGFMDSGFKCAIYDLKLEENETSIKTSIVEYHNSQFEANSFHIGLDNKELQEVFSISKENLKPQMFGNDILNNVSNIIQDSNVNSKVLKVNGVEFKKRDLNTVFGAICELKELSQGKVVATNRFSSNESVCEKILNIISKCKFDINTQNHKNKLFVPLAIKGRVGTGKSTLLNVLYWEMLLRQKQKFEYIPIMINFAQTSNEHLREQIIKIKDLSSIYKKSIYILIDGLDNCQIYNKDTADNLWREIESLKGVDCKVVFCINQHYKSFLETRMDHRNSFEFINNNKTSKYLLYLKPISYVEKFFHYQKKQKGLFCKQFNVTDKLKEFFSNYIHSYFLLSNYNDVEKENALYALIKDNDTLYLDFDLLHLFRINQINHSTKNYDKMNSLYFNSGINKNVMEAAKTYLTTNECMEKSKFFLLTSYNVINFAFSQYIINQLNNKKNIVNTIMYQTHNPIFPQKYFNKELNGFIQICMSGINNKINIKNNIIYAIRSTIERKLKLNYVAVAQLIYILRYAGIQSIELDGLMQLIKNHIKNNNKKRAQNETRNNFLIALRTIEITEIYHNDNYVYKYIQELIKSRETLALNRKFSLFYYGDIENLSIENNEYYRTFSCLYYRIYKHIKENHLGYIDFDLFTVCNIVQIKAQQILASTEVPTNMYLFNTIAMIYDLLKIYFESRKVTEKNKQIYYYFYSVKNDFGHLLVNYFDSNRSLEDTKKATYILKHIENDETIKLFRQLKCIPFNREESFETMLFTMDNLTIVNRAGWFDRINLGKVRCESVAEHTFSVMLIAWFISDDHAKIREKLLVLSFLHDLVEAYYGDVTPNNEDYKIVQECVKITTLALVYICTYNGFICWANYADLIISYIFPQQRSIGIDENHTAGQLLKTSDVLQRGIKLVKYCNEGITIEYARKAEFIKEISNLDDKIDESLDKLKYYILNQLKK